MPDEFMMAGCIWHLLGKGGTSHCRKESFAQELGSVREAMLQAVSNDAWALLDASLELRSDPEIVMKAVSQRGRCL